VLVRQGFKSAADCHEVFCNLLSRETVVPFGIVKAAKCLQRLLLQAWRIGAAGSP